MAYSGRVDEADLILGEILSELEVPAAKYDEAKSHYTTVGNWLNDEKSDLAKFDPSIYPHGSFAIGTAIKPIGKEELDVDAACVLSRPTSYTQKELKIAVGRRLKESARYLKMLEPPEGGRRCWTLQYAEGTRFHLDVLPAVPDDIDWLLASGVSEEYAKYALRITDTTTWDRPNYWPRSNPKGYAAWFRDSMKVILREYRLRKAMEKRADVESVPDYEVSTPLQQVVKILKRHRDVRYGGHEDRPISIVITTLAARAYQGEEGIIETLKSVVPRMRGLLFRAGGFNPVLNPVDPKEDFTDKWKAKPQRATVFAEWLDAIERDHDTLLTPVGFDALNENLAKSYGRADAAAALAKHASRQTNFQPVAPSPRSLLLPSAPHRVAAKWPMNVAYIIGLSCRAERDGWRPKDLSSGDAIDKHVSLTFTASIGGRYDEIYWQVVNTGREAARAGQLRGGFERGGKVKTESTLYAGMHWVQCFAIWQGICVARSSEFVVKITD